jgi:hypothetical protein
MFSARPGVRFAAVREDVHAGRVAQHRPGAPDGHRQHGNLCRGSGSEAAQV